jgi:hypothetical protein
VRESQKEQAKTCWCLLSGARRDMPLSVHVKIKIMLTARGRRELVLTKEDYLTSINQRKYGRFSEASMSGIQRRSS